MEAETLGERQVRPKVRPAEGTPALREALRSMGHADRHERGKALWLMFHETYMVLRAIAEEIEANERGAT